MTSRLARPNPWPSAEPGQLHWRAYGAASSPGFVIDRNGRIVLRQVWIDPEEIDTVLDSLLTRPLRPARLSRLVPKSGSGQ